MGGENSDPGSGPGDGGRGSVWLWSGFSGNFESIVTLALPSIASPGASQRAVSWGFGPKKGGVSRGTRAPGPPGGSHQLGETFPKPPIPAPVGLMAPPSTPPSTPSAPDSMSSSRRA